MSEPITNNTSNLITLINFKMIIIKNYMFNDILLDNFFLNLIFSFSHFKSDF